MQRISVVNTIMHCPRFALCVLHYMIGFIYAQDAKSTQPCSRNSTEMLRMKCNKKNCAKPFNPCNKKGSYTHTCTAEVTMQLSGLVDAIKRVKGK